MGGTEAFPDLGKHCHLADCRLLDFLPFTCDSCRQVFCLEHKNYKSHDCPIGINNKNRRVTICETCGISIEVTGCDGEAEKLILEKHQKSGTCDPKKKKKKPTCPVKRCRETLSFSNSNICKNCEITFCLRHRFPADHTCMHLIKVPQPRVNNKFLLALTSRSSKDCAKDVVSRSISSPGTPSVKAN
ncbi:hypothetical protein ACFE04_010436 [Oxalis oulophora]